MTSKLYIGDGTATPSIVIEKPLPMPLTIQKAKSNNKVVGGNTIIDLNGATGIGDFGLYAAYCLNPNITGNVDFSSLTSITGNSACYLAFSKKFITPSTEYEWEGSGGTYTGVSNITGIDLSNVTAISGQNACREMFLECDKLVSADLSNLTVISGKNSCYNMFRKCTSLTSIDLSKLTKMVDKCSCMKMFEGCTNLSGPLDLSSLTLIKCESESEWDSHETCYSMFENCSKITSVDLSSLTEINGRVIAYQMFQNCTSLVSADLRNLKKIVGSECTCSLFNGCTSLTSVNLSGLEELNDASVFHYTFAATALTNISFDSLHIINIASQWSEPFAYAFYQCQNLQNIYFPALTSQTFGSYLTYFNNMIYGCTGVTIHFPSNLEAKIQTLNGYPNFGGTSTILSFDLPATE